MSVQPCEQPSCTELEGPIELTIESKVKDLGELEVRRALPARERQRVGPFIFFDHMGPSAFEAGQGMSVRPHPHIGLATVTYLFDGTIRHQDSLGFDQEIRPGAVNWMTAGRGIVHSERTPAPLIEVGSRLLGFQVWLALPMEAEETEPSFEHYPAEVVPKVELEGCSMQLVAGKAYGVEAPVKTFSPLFYVAGSASAGASVPLPADYEDRAIYLADGAAEIDGHALVPGSLSVLRTGAEPTLEIEADARLALLGGDPLPGERHVWWNFVSSSRERIEQAKADWKEGRFPEVPGDAEFIPLPDA